MSTILLIRHGETDYVGKRLAGRTPGVHLNGVGRTQAEQLARMLSAAPIEAVFSGPLERAQETAAPLGAHLGLECQTLPELDELDFGEWTNCTFEELAPEPRWQQFNDFRSQVAPPGGEHMLEVQARAIAALERLRTRYGIFAIVSHCDVIRAVLVDVLRMSLDQILTLEVAPASISIIEMGDAHRRVTLVNRRCDGRIVDRP